MTARKTPILLRRGPMSGRVMAIHRYTLRPIRPGGKEIVVAATDGKQDVSADFDALMLDELMADDAPDMVAILDGVADGHEITSAERAQVRRFHDRLRAACERHNERIDSPRGRGQEKTG